MTRHFFLFAGEASGDLHGGHLMQSLQRFNPWDSCQMTGVGGPSMRAQGLDPLLPMENFAVMGFSDVLKSLPKLWKQFYIVRDAILKQKPDAVILIDYPGFNLRLAKALRRKGFKGKIVQYICPTVWAHSAGRIDHMAQTLDMLLTIFPFEADYFSHTSLWVHYIGNPLMEDIQRYAYDLQWIDRIGLKSKEHLVALFPGSREGEIARNLPFQLEVAALFKKQIPQAFFGLSYAEEHLLPLIHHHIERSSLRLGKDILLIPKYYRYELMRDCQTALAKSGTVTLELALHKRPSVVTYQVSALNYFMAKYLLRLKLSHYCIVNILKGQTIFPEHIGRHLKADRTAADLIRLHRDVLSRQVIQQACEDIQTNLGQHSTHQRAAQLIWELCT